MSSRKRGRAEYSANQRKAIAISAKIRAKYPYKDWGVAYKRRGTPMGIAHYGETYRLANEAQRQHRKEDGWVGRGDYKEMMRKYIPRGTFAKAGSYLGGLTGIPGAGLLGAYAGGKLSNYVGFGDYGGDAGGNQIMAGSVDTPIQVNQSKDLTGDVTLQHREFLGNVTATGGAGNISPFTVVPYALNPGLTASFPWLSQIAQNFELYEFQGIIYEFKPTSGELGATGTNSLGKIVMVTNYDPDAPVFSSSVQMENYDYANACKPSERMLHGVESHPAQRATKMMYTRTGASPKDKVLTDLGTFQIATEGLPITNGTTAIVGELWVTYTVKLSRAQLFGSLASLNVPNDQFIAWSNGTNLWENTQTQLLAENLAQYFQPVVPVGLTPRLNNNIGCSVGVVNNRDIKITFPTNIVEGFYQVQVYSLLSNALGTYSYPAIQSFLTLTNCAVVINPTYQFPLFQANILIGESKGSFSFFIKVTAPGSARATVQFTCYDNGSGGFQPPTNSRTIVQVTAVPQNQVLA